MAWRCGCVCQQRRCAPRAALDSHLSPQLAQQRRPRRQPSAGAAAHRARRNRRIRGHRSGALRALAARGLRRCAGAHRAQRHDQCAAHACAARLRAGALSHATRRPRARRRQRQRLLVRCAAPHWRGSRRGRRAYRRACAARRPQPARRRPRRGHGCRAGTQLHVGDGRLGFPTLAPYAAIHVGAAAPADVPPALLQQLASPGRLVCPVQGADGQQEIIQIDKDEHGTLTRSSLMGVRYVPLCDMEEQLRLR